MNNRSIVVATLFSGLLPALGLPVSVAAGPPGLEDGLRQARQQLHYDREAARRIQVDLDRVRTDPGATPALVARYSGYLQRARQRVAVDRERLRQLEARRSPASRNRAAPAAVPPVRFEAVPVITEADERRRKQVEFTRSLGDFDEMLLRDADVASQRSAERSSRSAGGGGGAGGGAGSDGEKGAGGESVSGKGSKTVAGTEGSATATRASQRSTSTTRRTGLKGHRTSSGSLGRTGRRTPPDVPDGNDDDVVARQIREAAEQEADPKVREKLWQEYRDYKQATR